MWISLCPLLKEIGELLTCKNKLLNPRGYDMLSNYYAVMRDECFYVIPVVHEEVGPSCFRPFR